MNYYDNIKTRENPSFLFSKMNPIIRERRQVNKMFKNKMKAI